MPCSRTPLPEHQDAHERHEAALQAEADRLSEISQHIYGTIAANKAALDAYMATVTTCNANGGIGDSSGRRHLQSGSCETDCSADKSARFAGRALLQSGASC